MLFPHKIASKYLMSMMARLLFHKSFKPPTKTSSQKTCLIIRLDGIGDYVLFRGFIKELKTSKKYKDYKFTLLCDSSLQGFADKLDGQYVDELIWLKRKDFFRKPLYALRFLRYLSNLTFDTVISPVYTRNFFFTDTFVSLIKAKDKIGSSGDNLDISNGQKVLSNGWYTRLLPASKGLLFEFDRNKEFFELLTEEKSHLIHNEISLDFKNFSDHLKVPNESYAVLFLGGSEKQRQWHWQNYLLAGKYLYRNYGLKTLLCGGKSEEEEAHLISEELGSACVNLVGRTSLHDMLFILSRAQLLISNETGAVHMATALNPNKKIIVLSNGNNLGRFAPYPSTYKNYHILLPQKFINCLSKNPKNYFNKPSYFNINEIKFNEVQQTIDLLFLKKPL